MIGNDHQGRLYEGSGTFTLSSLFLWNLNKTKAIIKGFQLLKYLGPAFIVSVAYIDPGNFATNISAGSEYAYGLIWVILWSNIMAIFLQIISAKLGIATGYNLSQMCSRIFSKRVNWFLWMIAELAAMATTLAEFLGGALGLHLLFKMSFIYAGLLTGAITFLITYLEKYGQRMIELIISSLILIICVAYGLELFLARPDWIQVGIHTFIPVLKDDNAVLIAVGMLGATVMPHVIFLHSQLVQCRNDPNDESKKKHLRMEKIDITIAMNIAFVVNAAMVIVSAAVFYNNGVVVDNIEQAHKSLEPLLGAMSSWAFAVALLASGFSSSAVGTMAGETVMDGFVNIRIPLIFRRLITMVPAIAVISLGFNPMKVLIMSQVLLSFALPAAIIPLMLITSRKDIMGGFVNSPFIKFFGWLITCVIIGLNCLLLFLTFYNI